jgi:hypothetical protein
LPMISHTFHIVDRLPHGALALVADEDDGECHQYLSRESLSGALEDLGELWTYIGQAYEHLPHEVTVPEQRVVGLTDTPGPARR